MQERNSVFDIFKIGIGPSSSHTMGPWKAVQLAIQVYKKQKDLHTIQNIKVELFGSLAKTGKGHGTDMAILLGLLGYDVEYFNPENINSIQNKVNTSHRLHLYQKHWINFNPAEDIIFNFDQQLPHHPNALKVHIKQNNGITISSTYYSVGGGFVVSAIQDEKSNVTDIPYPIDSAKDLLKWCNETKWPIWKVVLQNELKYRNEAAIHTRLQTIWEVMKQCMFRGCHKDGTLPGGLQVHRRASYQNKKLIEHDNYDDIYHWIQLIKKADHSFTETLNWVSCFALAVNEENAAFGQVVTAPTNGAAGVIPAVMMYYLCFINNAREDELEKFLLTAGIIGSIFKNRATLSAAMGGCQAEIGVSSAMAAAGLTACLVRSDEKALMAAEIAMEHHLGLTCDPVAGLVQIPCIERNAMGAMKAITATHIAMASDPNVAKVSLDSVIKSMWETAKDMNSKYKETSEGGLAINIPVSHSEC